MNLRETNSQKWLKPPNRKTPKILDERNCHQENISIFRAIEISRQYYAQIH